MLFGSDWQKPRLFFIRRPVCDPDSLTVDNIITERSEELRLSLSSWGCGSRLVVKNYIVSAVLIFHAKFSLISRRLLLPYMPGHVQGWSKTAVILKEDTCYGLLYRRWYADWSFWRTAVTPPALFRVAGSWSVDKSVYHALDHLPTQLIWYECYSRNILIDCMPNISETFILAKRKMIQIYDMFLYKRVRSMFFLHTNYRLSYLHNFRNRLSGT